MKINVPLVSVVIPFYKNLKFLNEAIESVQNQTLKDFEIIIISDGALEEIPEKIIINENIRIIKTINQGASKARNLGIKNSNGKYIAFLDSDDIWSPIKLELQIAYMEKFNLIWSHHNYFYFKNNISILTKKLKLNNLTGDVTQKILGSFKAQTSTFIINRSIFINNDYYLFPDDRFHGEDVYFYLKISENFKLGHLKTFLSYFRIHGNNQGFKINNHIFIRYKIFHDFLFTKHIKTSKIKYFFYKFCSYLYLYKFKSSILKKLLYLPAYLYFKFINL